MLRSDRAVVVLRVYGDTAVAARLTGFREIDPDTRMVLRLGDENVEVLDRRKVGPLTNARD